MRASTLLRGWPSFSLKERGRLRPSFPGFEEFFDLRAEAVAEHGLLADQLLHQGLEAVKLVGRNGRKDH